MNEFQLTKMDGELYADSREVAEKIERPHYELLKSIRKYCEFLTEGNFPVSEYFVPADVDPTQRNSLKSHSHHNNHLNQACRQTCSKHRASE